MPAYTVVGSRATYISSSQCCRYTTPCVYDIVIVHVHDDNIVHGGRVCERVCGLLLLKFSFNEFSGEIQVQKHQHIISIR
jgi:hypothetical protein